MEALTLIEESRHHEAVLAAEANDQRCHEVAAWTVESEALTLVRRHEAETWASLSTVSPLADELPELLRRRSLRWRFIPVPDITVALVNATSLVCPVVLSRWLPPTQNFCRGGFQRQRQPCWRKRLLGFI